MRDISWSYTFREDLQCKEQYRMYYAKYMFQYVHRYSAAVTLPRVRQAWTNNRHEGLMKKEAVSFSRALDECVESIAEDRGHKGWIVVCQTKLREARVALESW